MHGFRTLHLFAGLGGGILADLLLGHQCVGAVEIDEYCQRLLLIFCEEGSEFLRTPIEIAWKFNPDAAPTVLYERPKTE